MTHRYSRFLFPVILLIFLAVPARMFAGSTGLVDPDMDAEAMQTGISRPVLSSIAPESALAGETLDLVLLGANFQSGISSFAISGSGIKVLKTVVISSFQIRVTIQIEHAALPGKRNIRVVNDPPSGGSSASHSFSVKPPPHPEPLLLRFSPSSAMQGDTVITEISGRAFIPEHTFVLLEGEGMKLEEFEVLDSRNIRAKLTIDELARPGRRDLSVVTPGPGGGRTEAKAFMVKTAPYPRPSWTEEALQTDAIVRGEQEHITLTGRGIRDVSHVSFPDDVEISNLLISPPASVSFFVKIPREYDQDYLPVVIRNPKPGGGESDTLKIPVMRPPNRAPLVERVLRSFRIAVGQVVKEELEGIRPVFSDPDGDTLNYRVVSDDMAVFAEIRDGEMLLRGNVEGRAMITLLAHDQEDRALIQFPVEVFIPVPNKAPTLNNLARMELPASAPPQEVFLRGITAGEGEAQKLEVTARSSNTRLIPHPEIIYQSPDTDGQLLLRPQPGITGTATITVRVRDDGGTAFNGVNQVERSFVVTVRDMEMTASDTEEPGRFRLEQNYPNPFNPSTTIEYSIGEAAHVRLTIWDVTGRPVVRLVDQEQAAGFYSITFTADKIPSGTYLYRLEAGRYTETRTMSLIK